MVPSYATLCVFRSATCISTMGQFYTRLSFTDVVVLLFAVVNYPVFSPLSPAQLEFLPWLWLKSCSRSSRRQESALPRRVNVK